MKKILSLVTVLALCLTLFAVPAGAAGTSANDTHTYNAYTELLGENWNPHTWVTSADNVIQTYVMAPLADLAVKDSSTGEYQWIFVAAESITDVTAAHQDDLTKYGCTTPEGLAIDDVEAGYVFEIALRPGMCWEDGTVIDADTYIYSMQQLLDGDMENYRASNYVSGMYALAGAEDYYYSGSTAVVDNSSTGAITGLSDLVKGSNGVYTTADGQNVYIVLSGGLQWLGGESLDVYVDAYGDMYFDVTAYDSLKALADENGNVAITDETWDMLTALISVPNWGEGEGYEYNYLYYEQPYPEFDWDGVGLYKVDDYTIRYVCKNICSYPDFLTLCTSNWIVHEELYEECKADGSYNTSAETTLSCYAYRIGEMKAGEYVSFVRNETYWEYKKAADGSLSSTTFFKVDGENQPQFLTDEFVIRVLSEAEAKEDFLNGELDEWTPGKEDLLNYDACGRMYPMEETYTFRLIFHTNPDSLKMLDAEGDNTNSVVLSNDKFRQAMSLAIDRADLVSATAGYKPAHYLVNHLYFYDVFQDPGSVYRNSDQAKQAICDLYGVEYGSGTSYATLDEAYASIDGYNLTEAKALFAEACDELVEAGLYKEGEPIVIEVGWIADELEPGDRLQETLLNKYLNAAMADSGFGTMELKLQGEIADRYSDIYSGNYAVGRGAWGGAAFNPYGLLRLYFDNDYMGVVYEGGCWDPSTEALTLEVDGEKLTMTWKEWAQSLDGGELSFLDNDIRLAILAEMESRFLAKYYCIPLYDSTVSVLLSQKVEYYTDDYNIMYGFGGTRLLKYNYSDSEWADFVADGGVTAGCLAVTGQPEDVKASAEETVSFEVEAEGVDLTYQWQYKTAGSTKWYKSPAEGNKTNTLTIPATTDRNGNQYRCVITDRGGNTVTSDAATLTVMVLPEITAQPANKTVNLGTNAKFTVKATGEGLTYRWQYKAPGGTWKATYATGYKTNTLVIPGTADRNGYQYRCMVTNGAGGAVYTNAAKLTVVSLSVTTQPKDMIMTGGTAKFIVAATGNGLTYQWQFKTPTGSWANSPATGSKTAVLNVPVTADRNGNRYRCKITDSNGNVVYSDAAKLTVFGITSQPVNKTANLGTDTKFTVKATGAGLTYRWQYKAPGGTWKATYAEGYKTAALTIPATADRNGYQYRCKITDSSGNVVYSTAAKLTVISLSITAQPKDMIMTGGTAKFTVAATGNGLTYQWQFKTPTGSWANSPAAGSKTAVLNVPVTADRNGNRYRCKITDSNGNVVYSDAAKLTVFGITSQPVNKTANLGTDTKFTVKATGAGLTYRWQYKAPGGTWKATYAEGYKTAALTIPGTADRNGYQYRCIVTDGSGNSVISGAATLTVK